MLQPSAAASRGSGQEAVAEPPSAASQDGHQKEAGSGSRPKTSTQALTCAMTDLQMTTQTTAPPQQPQIRAVLSEVQGELPPLLTT